MYDAMSDNTERPLLDLTHYEMGSSMEMARQAALALNKKDVPRVSEQMKNYQPSQEEAYLCTEDKSSCVRTIYSGVELTVEEQLELNNFKQWLRDQGLMLPKGYLDEHNYALRFLTKNSNFEEAYNLIIQKEQWVVDNLIPSLTDTSKQIKNLESGAMYAYGRDKHMRPIVIQRTRDLID